MRGNLVKLNDLKVVSKLYFLAGIFIFLFNISSAQNRWEVQFRPGLNFTTEDFAGASIKTGFGFELAGAYHFTKHLGGYVGWGWNEYRADNSLGNSLFDVEERGYTFGVQYKYPIPDSNLSYFLQAGAIYNHLELEDSSGNITNESNYGFGWQAGAGLEFTIGGDFALRPTLRYRSLARDMKLNDNEDEATLNNISVGIGLLKRF